MSTELTILVYAALLQCAQFILVAVPTNLEVGTAKTLSPRDTTRLGGPLTEQVSERTARLIRAFNNHTENLILFAIAVLAVHLGDKTSGLTANLCWTYLTARILYIPAYYFGLTPWRSLIWFAGWLSTVGLLLLAAL